MQSFEKLFHLKRCKVFSDNNKMIISIKQIVLFDIKEN